MTVPPLCWPFYRLITCNYTKLVEERQLYLKLKSLAISGVSEFRNRLIRDSLEVAQSQGIIIERSKICGGGAKSPLWKKIMANVLNVKLDTVASEQGPGMGGAMLAMVADGVYPSVQAVCDHLVRVVDTVEPEPKLAALYEARYRQFAKIYPAMKDLFPKIL